MHQTVLVTGAAGQLGSELQVLAASYPHYQFIFVNRSQLAIDNEAAVIQFFEQHQVNICINCAAYTAVDKAEEDTAAAYAINAQAAALLASCCRQQQAMYIHISTDYVFNGLATEPYTVNHPVDPVNAYGASKLKGEALVQQQNPASIIIRTSWVYSSFGNNFVKTMLRLMKDRPLINVVNDQVGCPTYAADLAAVILQIANQPLVVQANPGIYHYSNSGVISWYQFAVAIKEMLGSDCIVNPIPSIQYPTPAKRPGYSVLDTTKIQQVFNVPLTGWKDSLQKCLQLLQP
jgi:dTDP-4-dehydrorhamnose reductase